MYSQLQKNKNNETSNSQSFISKTPINNSDIINPYTHERTEIDVLINIILTLFAPACIALLASLIKKPSLMFIAFVWSHPISLYMTMTPSVFKLFGCTSLMYLISGILTIRENRSRHKGIS